MLQREVSTKRMYAEAQSYNEDMKLTLNPTFNSNCNFYQLQLFCFFPVIK